MTPRIADLGDVIAHPWATPAPTPQPQPTPTDPFPAPFPTGPRVDDPGLHRWAPNADRATLGAILDDIAAMPPVGPLLDALNRAVERSREVR